MGMNSNKHILQEAETKMKKDKYSYISVVSFDDDGISIETAMLVECKS